ncbi:MAG: FkbM family methyltransferase [Telluria sp.]|nr:FkbM family methyltransferase [Telluria sp.]
MTFISYAQNGEDVLLWRVLGHIKNGFYIDVGANDPVMHSVTAAFYAAGWHGINIEPLPSYHQGFVEQRPRDVNLALAAGSADGEVTLFDVPSVDGWASSDPTVAAAHRAEGFEVSEIKVPMRTLAGICAEHVRGEIHFLKIDVEGFEGEVLRGMDFERWRPWVLVIEATLPNSRVVNFETWEHLVTQHAYQFAYFDGLNRYYVAAEHAQLGAALALQPNVFDDFISHHLDKAWRANEQAVAAGKKIQQEAAEAQARSLARAERSDWLADVAAQRATQADAAAAASHAIAESALARAAGAEALTQQALAALQEAQHSAGEALARADSAARAAREAEARAHNAEHAYAAAVHQHTLSEEANRQVTQWALELEQRLLAVHNSWSWRLSHPVRLAGAALRVVTGANPRQKLGALLLRGVHRVGENERARRVFIPLLRRFPALREGVSQTIATIKQAAPPDTGAPAQVSQVAVPEELRALPLSARKVLADLKRSRRPPTSS